MEKQQLSLEIQSLKRDIERETKILITGHKACTDLSAFIKKKIGINLSYKTLLRLFNLTKDSDTRNTSTESLNILCRLIKKDNWEQYCKEYRIKNGKDVLFNPRSIIVSNLAKRQIVKIGWKNIYYMEARYLGNYEFEVLFSENMRHIKDDKFTAIRFDVILPIYLHEKNPENPDECLEGYKPYPDIVIIKEEKKECLEL
ncbi:hypothetical protein [Bacteroides sp.]|uniref:hypothetical protein n=1 Tax=Bacteroides sp. TaxID=29523 RepID=UPI0025C4C790|nr:hypothetical protein [Bacteroides sp.]